MFSANHLRALFASLDDGISPLFSGQTKGRITRRKGEEKKTRARKRNRKGKERKRTRKQQELVRLLSRSLN
jgi:hypothetical protein